MAIKRWRQPTAPFAEHVTCRIGLCCGCGFNCLDLPKRLVTTRFIDAQRVAYM